MRGIARLEREDHVGALFLERRVHFLRRQAILVQPVVVRHLLPHLDLAPDEPVAARVYVVYVRVAHVNGSETARHDLLLAVLVHLRGPEDGQSAAVLVDERPLSLIHI